MSDRQDRDTEQPAQDGAGVASDAPEAPEAHDAEEEPREAVPATAASVTAGSAATTARGGSSVIGWLALLLVLALSAGALWWYLQSQQLERELRGRIAQLEATADARESDVAALGARWQEQLRSDVERMRSGLRGELGTELRHQLQVDLRDELHGTLRRELLQQSQRQAAAIKSFAAELARQREQLARYSANDGESWLLAEAEYLLRLANQRVIMTGDAVAAQALLETADDILQEMDDPGLHPVRAALASDLAALRAVPGVDVDGLYLRLAALLGQADALVIFELPEAAAQPRPEEADTWRGRLRQGYESALRKLSDYIVIRRRDVPVQSLMDPQWEGLVRQNLRMLLEQAQVALLSGNQRLYRESLGRARRWVGEFFASDGAAARAMAREIDQLADATITVALPDVSTSLRALDEAMQQRLQQRRQQGQQDGGAE